MRLRGARAWPRLDGRAGRAEWAAAGGTMMSNLVWWVAIAGCGIAALYLLAALFGGSFAPQQRTELATLAIAFAVVPYCLVQALLRLFGDRR